MGLVEECSVVIQCITFVLQFYISVTHNPSCEHWDGKLYGSKKVMKMSEKEISITLRMGIEDFQMMEDFMSENGIDGRSHFIRDAISGYIASQRSGVSRGADSEGGIFVRFKEVQMDALRLMVEDGTAFDEEEYVRKCVLEKLISRDAEADSADRAFKAAQMASKMK